MSFEGCLYAKTVRSEIPHGKIKKIHFNSGIPWKEFVVATAKDIPGKNVVTLIQTDQPLLVDSEIRHAAEPIALIAHSDKDLVEKAIRNIRVEYEPLPAILSIDESLAGKNIQLGTDNIFKEFHMRHGDTNSAWPRADVIIERTYETGAQEQLYIEPNGVAAVASPKKGVTVWGSMQCPYYAHKALVPVFGLPAEQVRVIQTVTGGGFGGKEEFPSVPSGHAALLSWKAGGRPVKLIYDRFEDMWATTKRHPCRTRIKSGFTRDGKLVALEIDVTMDGGAYLTVSSVVLSRGTLHSFGPYRCDNVRVDSRVVFTNSPPYGAFRGFGAPQTIFAMELHMDEAAEKLGIEPHEIRRKNFLKKGDAMATGQIIKEDLDLDGILTRAMKESDYLKKRKAHAVFNKKNALKKRAIALSTFFHGSGFTGSGEVFLASRAAVELQKDGRVRVLSANTEIGQGTNTIFSQIVGETLGIPFEWVDVAQPDTFVVPNSGPTVASRTCMIVGNILRRAAHDLREILVKSAGLSASDTRPESFRAAALRYLRNHGELRVLTQYEKPADVTWDDQTYRGEAYGAYAWACYVSDLELDLTTYQAEVKDFVAVQEVGRVVHPVLAMGQIEGGVAQGIGWALYEKVVLKDGVMQNIQLTNYIVPTSADTPPIRVFFQENPYARGPYGAKGLGELPMDGPAPAIASALSHALGGRWVRSIPVMPEDIMVLAGARR